MLSQKFLLLLAALAFCVCCAVSTTAAAKHLLYGITAADTTLDLIDPITGGTRTLFSFSNITTDDSILDCVDIIDATSAASRAAGRRRFLVACTQSVVVTMEVADVVNRPHDVSVTSVANFTQLSDTNLKDRFISGLGWAQDLDDDTVFAYLDSYVQEPGYVYKLDLKSVTGHVVGPSIPRGSYYGRLQLYPNGGPIAVLSNFDNFGILTRDGVLLTKPQAPTNSTLMSIAFDPVSNHVMAIVKTTDDKASWGVLEFSLSDMKWSDLVSDHLQFGDSMVGPMSIIPGDTANEEGSMFLLGVIIFPFDDRFYRVFTTTPDGKTVKHSAQIGQFSDYVQWVAV